MQFDVCCCKPKTFLYTPAFCFFYFCWLLIARYAITKKALTFVTKTFRTYSLLEWQPILWEKSASTCLWMRTTFTNNYGVWLHQNSSNVFPLLLLYIGHWETILFCCLKKKSFIYSYMRHCIIKWIFFFFCAVILSERYLLHFLLFDMIFEG